jgi:hypothetical protein
LNLQLEFNAHVIDALENKRTIRDDLNGKRAAATFSALIVDDPLHDPVRRCETQFRALQGTER